MLDFTTPFGQRAAGRLQQEEIIWLTTVGDDGMPQPSPVWFLWEGDTVLIYSQPKTPKVANIGSRPQVALHLDGDGKGGDIVVLTGRAEVSENAAPVTIPAAYLAKYAAGIKDIGMTPEQMAASFSAVIRVTPTKLRGH